MDWVMKLFRLFTCAALGVVLSVNPGCRCQELEPLIVGAEVASIENFPYHVAVYENIGIPGAYQQICGGTLISTTQVVTAAHCVWNDEDRRQNSSELYMVAAGKTHRSWNFRPNARAVQRRRVAKITLPRRYLGLAQFHAYDIALFTLAKPMTLTPTVGVAHIDWHGTWTAEQFATGSNGNVAGWGQTETGQPSDILKFVSLPYVDPDTCFDSLSDDLKKFLAHDKFCAGFVGKSVSVCRGDSGGGLVFYHAATDKHYLRGVVSLAFRPANNKDACYAQHYAAFTTVTPAVVRQLQARAAMDIPVQVEECGRRGRTATPLIVGGRDAGDTEFPWHVGVHERKPKNTYVCGGTLISTKFVVTAAFCIYNEKYSKVSDASKFLVTLGTDQNLTLPSVQTFGLAKITIAKNYTGRDGNYANNIGVLQLAREAVLSRTVAPVCVDWDNAFDDEQLGDGVNGVVSGFGITNTRSRELASVLQWVELPYINHDTCFKYALTQRQAAGDLVFEPNFCTGGVNMSRRVCVGDGGGGFNVLRASSQRYYLRGVLSVSIMVANRDREDTCSNEYATLTRLSPFLGWIRQVMAAAL